MTRRVEVKFAHEHVPRILERDKWMTLRYHFEDPLAPGDDMVMLTEDADPFAVAPLDRRLEVTPGQFVSRRYKGHRRYEHVGELMQEMSGYYPDERIGPGAMLDLFIWDPDDLRPHPDYRNSRVHP